MMITPRNDTEELLLDGLHREPRSYRPASRLYDKRVTRHVHDALRRWEQDGVVERSPHDRWSTDPYWRVSSDHLDRARRRRILCEEAGRFLKNRINTQQDLDKYTAAVRDSRAKINALYDQWEETGDGIGEIEVTTRGVAFAAARITQRTRALEHIDAAIAEFRDGVAREGFDPDAIMAGLTEDPPADGDPLGEGA